MKRHQHVWLLLSGSPLVVCEETCEAYCIDWTLQPCDTISRTQTEFRCCSEAWEQ